LDDKTVYILRHTSYARLPRSAAVNRIALGLDFSVEGVSGMLSRAENSPQRTSYDAEILEVLQNDTHLAPAKLRQKEILYLSDEAFTTWKDELPDHEVAAVFISDAHIPGLQRAPFHLALEIIGDVNPVAISGMNDAVDHKGFGRWDDGIPKTDAEADLDALRLQELAYYNALRRAAPNAAILGVPGNHDLWYMAFTARQMVRGGSSLVADYMEFLYHQCDVWQFTDSADNEAEVVLSPGLIWWHGQFASMDAKANANKTLAQFTDKRIVPSVTVGHTHRPAYVPGYQVGKTGANFYNSGCLCSLKPRYMKRRPQGWAWAIVVNYFVPNTTEERGYVIEFRESGNRLEAEFNGRRYSVPI
jgi:hypothetical protein